MWQKWQRNVAILIKLTFNELHFRGIFMKIEGKNLDSPHLMVENVFENIDSYL